MKLEMLVPVLSAIGFGIQQFLQVLVDPVVSALIDYLKDKRGIEQANGTKLLPGGISDVDAKKALLGFTSIVIGVIIASYATEIRILAALGLAGLPWLDWFITALTVSAGTEGANTILKLAQYVKDAVKAKTPPSVAQNSPVPQSPANKIPSATINAGVDGQSDFAMTPNSGDDADAATEANPDATTGAAAGDALNLVDSSALGSTASVVAPWRVAKSLLVLRDQINAKAPNRNKASDGFIGDAAHASRQSDHNPWVKDGNVGVVTAFDITHDPNGGCDGNEISSAIRNSRDDRVKYIIWNRRIANSSPIGGSQAWEWRPYVGPKKDPHTNHVHVSVKSDKPHYDLTTAWTI